MTKRQVRRAMLQAKRSERRPGDSRKQDSRRAFKMTKNAIDDLRAARATIDRLIRMVPEADPLEDHLPALMKLLKAMRALRDDLGGTG